MQLFKAHPSGLTQLSLPTFPSSLRPQKYDFSLLLFCLVLSLQTYGGWRKVLPPLTVLPLLKQMYKALLVLQQYLLFKGDGDRV